MDCRGGVCVEPRQLFAEPWQPQGRARADGQLEEGTEVGANVAMWAELASCVCVLFGPS